MNGTSTHDATTAVDRSARLRALSARMLRGLGATVLIASLSVFLFQGWSDTGDLGRFTLLLAQTGLLMAAGFASGRWLREPKGARVFVGIALVAVVANFAVLGGLVQSQYGTLTANAPAAMIWEAASGAWALGTAALAVLLLTPLCRIGFTVLARASAPALTLLLLGNAAILLVPTRGALAATALAVAALVATAVTARRCLPRDAGLRTPEGLFALAVPLIPVGVILGRSILFYPGATLPMAVGILGFYAALREAAAHTEPTATRRSLEGIGALTVLPAAIALTAAAAEMTPLAPAGWLPVMGLTGAALFLDLARVTRTDTGGYRLAAATMAALPMAVNGYLFDGLLVAVASLATGIAVAAYAFREQRVWLLAPAAIAMLTGLGELIGFAVGRFDIGAWGWLALIGIATVVAGSLVERGRPAAWLDRWKDRPVA